jgi:phospholipid/cholesterol/gamma-HCH transport system substrate-binding protein
MVLKFAAVIGAVLAAGFGALNLGLGGSQPYSITGHFLSAEGLTQGNDVLISGVPVGKIDSVALAPDTDTTGGALIKMTIDRKYAPLRRGTRATIRQKGFLGNMYVELAPGRDGNQAIPSGGMLPVQDTAAPVDLDQVMDIFDPATRAKVKTLTLEGGKSLDGRGADVNHILANLPQISGQFADAAGNLDRSQQQLDDLTAEFDRVSQQMAAEDVSLRSDLRNGASLLDTIAAREDRLQAEITYANQGLGAANAGLNGHELDLATLLNEIPGLQDHLKQLSAAADPALADINMCYPDIITAIAELRSATDYKHPQGAQDANGYMLRVQTNIAPIQNADTGSLHPAQRTCQGGTPTP